MNLPPRAVRSFHATLGCSLPFTGLGLSVVLAACSASPAKTDALPPITAVRGVVTTEQGAGLVGVQVTAGTVSATTNDQGEYVLRAPSGTQRLLYKKQGFLDVQRELQVSNGALTMQHAALKKLADPLPINLDKGGEISSPAGIKLTAGPSAFVDAAGKPMRGMAEVYLTPMPASDAASARTVSNFEVLVDGQAGLLESFGMVDVQVKQGEARLQVATGTTVDLRIPATGMAADAPVWSFDETKAEWVKEASTQTLEGGSYAFKVPHFSQWNVDKPYSTSCVTGRVKAKGSGKFLAGAQIEAQGTSYAGRSSAQTLEGGRFRIFVKKAEQFELSIVHGFDGGAKLSLTASSVDAPFVRERDVTPSELEAKVGDCLDVGEVEVIEDPWRDPPPQMGGGGCSNNMPNVGGCAAEFAEVTTCFKAEGMCVTRVLEANQGTRTTYENGSKMESRPDGTSSAYGPSGAKCYDLNTSQASSNQISYEVPNRGVYTLVFSNEGFIYRCPSGEETKITPAQAQQYQACQPALTPPATQNKCRIEAPGTCQRKQECKAAEVCCAQSPELAFCTTSEGCTQSKGTELP
jgi:hypothetical protein